MKIAVCDDDKIYADLITDITENVLKERLSNLSVATFYSGSDLISSCKKNLYSLILLDIDMPLINGFDVSAFLKENNIKSEIIFVSQRENFVFQSLKHRPYRFVRKSYIETDLSEGLYDFAYDLLKKNKIYRFQCVDRLLKLNLKQIQYFECYSHDIMLHTIDNAVYKLNRKYNLRILENELCNHGFIRIHKSFLVNYEHIQTIKSSDVILNDGAQIPLAKKRITAIKTTYRRFIMGG